MFYDGAGDVVRVIVIGIAAYVALVVLLRVTGKRTLSKMNAFDLIVTVALGSTLATILLSADVSLAMGITALALLIMLQYAVAWVSARVAWFRGLVKATPTLLVHNGNFLDDVLTAERVAREEVLAAIRQQGIANLADVGAVVLETDGSMSVIRAGDGLETVLQYVEKPSGMR